MRKSLLLFFIFLPLLSAQNEVALVRLWQQADSLNLDLQRLEGRVERATARLASERAGWGPVVGLQSGYKYQSEIFRITIPGTVRAIPVMQEHSYLNSVWFDWTLFNGLKRWYRIDAAKATFSAAEADKQFARATLRHQILRQGLHLQLHDQQLEIVHASRSRVVIDLQRARELHRAGQIASGDTLMLHHNLLELTKEESEILQAQRIGRLQLAALLNRHEPLIPILPQQLSLPVDTVGTWRQSYRSEALLRHRQAKREQWRAAAGNYWPQLRAAGAWRYDKPGYDPINNTWVNYVTLEFGLQWVLWDWQARSQHRQQLQIEYRDTNLQLRQYENERQLEDARISARENAIREKILLTQKQIELKQREYEQRQQQYTMAQIDAFQLATSEKELTILTWQYRLLETQAILAKIDRLYVRGQFLSWTKTLEQQQ
jgi:outer membrane protein TolC